MKRPHLNLKAIRQLRRASEESILNKSTMIESDELNHSLERSITPFPRQSPVPIQKASHFLLNNPLRLLEDKLQYSDLCNRNLELKLIDKDQKIKKLETTVARLHNEVKRKKLPNFPAKSSKELQESISRISTMNQKLCLQVQHVSNKENLSEAPQESKHLIRSLETQLEKTQSNYEKLLRSSISFEEHTRELYQANEALQLLLLRAVSHPLNLKSPNSSFTLLRSQIDFALALFSRSQMSC